MQASICMMSSLDLLIRKQNLMKIVLDYDIQSGSYVNLTIAMSINYNVFPL